MRWKYGGLKGLRFWGLGVGGSDPKPNAQSLKPNSIFRHTTINLFSPSEDAAPEVEQIGETVLF